MKIAKQQKMHKINTAVKVATIVAFLGVAAIATVATFQASSDLRTQEIADETNSPKLWSGVQSMNAVANSSMSAKVLDGRYVEFTSKVANANANEGLYVTHLASYMATDGEYADGFMEISKVEYTYSPSDSNSWQEIGLSRPAISRDAFKLAKDVHLGAAGTKTDTVYFRYYTIPDDKEAVTVNDKTSFLVRNEAGEIGSVASTATVAYNGTDTVVATTAGGETGDDEISNAYTNPLGRSSFVPTGDVVNSTVASVAGGVSGQAALIWGIVAAVGVGVFVICLSAYLIIRKR